MIQVVLILLGLAFLFLFGVRLILTVLLAFFAGLILASLVEYLEVGTDEQFSPSSLAPTLLFLGVAVALAVTAPARARLHLLLTTVVFTAFGYLMYQEEIFRHGSGGCTPLALGVCSAGLALVITYPRGEVAPALSGRGHKATAGRGRVPAGV
jgi:hypothetical protein